MLMMNEISCDIRKYIDKLIITNEENKENKPYYIKGYTLYLTRAFLEDSLKKLPGKITKNPEEENFNINSYINRGVPLRTRIHISMRKINFLKYLVVY